MEWTHYCTPSAGLLGTWIEFVAGGIFSHLDDDFLKHAVDRFLFQQINLTIRCSTNESINASDLIHLIHTAVAKITRTPERSENVDLFSL